MLCAINCLFNTVQILLFKTTWSIFFSRKVELETHPTFIGRGSESGKEVKLQLPGQLLKSNKVTSLTMAASFIRRALQPTYKCLNSNLYKSSVSQVRYLSLSSILKARLFTKDHEWITVEGQKGTVGISDYAQEKLGEIVYVETPEVGAKVEVEDVVGCLESVKAASDIYSPVGGTVTEINTELKSQPSLINSSPLEQGWLYKIDLAPDTNTDNLMDEKAYADFCSHDE